jgi:predicted SprT family Zn-dependent metalloprotease
MKEIRTEVKTFRVTLACDCGGEAISTGIVYSTWPEQIEYRCVKCEQKLASPNRYPCLRTEEI